MSPQTKNEITVEAAPKTLCILQLARIGDLIQTYIAAKSIKDSEDNKNLRIILIARKKYVTPLRSLLSECFDEIITLDYDKIIFDGKEVQLSNSLTHLDELLNNINTKTIHALVNLTFSKTSAYLSTLINSNFKLGVTFDSKHNLTIKDHWSQYVYSNVLTGPLNPFSLVDLFSKIIGSPGPKVTKKKNVSNPKKIILHPFTSQERKHWKPSKWSEILFNILKYTNDANIKIVGSEKDFKNIEQIITSPLLVKYKSNISNLAGKTTIEKTLQYLNESDLFLGHDSMVSHLASTTGVRSITIALGSVRPIETAPYGDGNYVLAPLTNCFPCFPDVKCESFKCHSDIPFQAINTFINNIMIGKEGKEVVSNLSPFHTSKVQIFKTKLNDTGFLSLEPLIDHHLDLKLVFQKLYRITWLYMLTEQEEASGFPSINQLTANQLVNYKDGIKHLYQITEFGKKYSTYILQEVASKTPSLAKIKDFSNKVVEIDKLQLQIKDAYPLLSPVIDYYAIIKANLNGENVVEITENAYISYENCSAFCNVLNELLEKTLGDFVNIEQSPRPTQG